MECLRDAGLVTIDVALSGQYLNMSADAKYPPAINTLAVCYEKGDGIKENKRRAFELYEEAECLNYVPSLVALRKCYENGVGTTQNDDEFVRVNQRLMFLNDYSDYSAV